MQNQDKRVDQLEKQIGQIAEFVGKFRDPGQLPSSTIPNPKGGFESAKAITLRSGKEVGAGPTSKTGHNEDEILQMEEEETRLPTAKVIPPLPQVPMVPNLPNSANKGKNVLNSVPTNVFPSPVCNLIIKSLSARRFVYHSDRTISCAGRRGPATLFRSKVPYNSMGLVFGVIVLLANFFLKSIALKLPPIVSLQNIYLIHSRNYMYFFLLTIHNVSFEFCSFCLIIIQIFIYLI